MFESLGLMLRISLQRFAQHDRSEDSQAMTWRSNLKRRLNSSADLRVLLLLFVATAVVFSALPLLRYFRGRTLFDYELWYETGQHVVAGHEIYFLVAINSAAWFYSAQLSALLAGGEKCARNVWLYLVPSLLVIVYIWSSYHLGQPNLVLLALMLGA